MIWFDSLPSYVPAEWAGTVVAIWATALRVWVGGVLVLYALRAGFGFFPNTGMPFQTIGQNAVLFNQLGWRPGVFWAWASTLNNLIGGAFLAAGFLTRPVALLGVVLLFLSADFHARRDGFFSNQNGAEHYVLWGWCVLLFVIFGGGPFSVDRLIGLGF